MMEEYAHTIKVIPWSRGKKPMPTQKPPPWPSLHSPIKA